MAKRKPLLIGQMQFKTQTDARKFIQEILNTATWLEPLEGGTHEFVLSLLERHPRVADKRFRGQTDLTLSETLLD